MDDTTPNHSKQQAHQQLTVLCERAMQIVSDVGMLFGGDSSHAKEVRRFSDRHIKIWETLCGNRGGSLPVIAFVGPVGAGKTTLARLLVSGDQSEVPTGQSSKGKLQWLGPTAPEAMEPGIEQFLRVQRDGLVDLGRPYLILDTPSFGKRSPRLEEVIQRAFASTRFKVLVVDSHKIGAQQWREEMSIGDGSIILPVIHMDPITTKEHRKAPSSVSEGLGSQVHKWLKEHMPGTKLHDPVILPDFDVMEDRSGVLRESRDLLAGALRAMLEAAGPEGSDRTAELEASWAVYLSGLREILHPLITDHVQMQHTVLDQVLRSMPKLVADEMLQDDRGLTALVRLDLRALLMERIPGWAFPFRACAGLLCLTTGLWDRVVLGMAGSVPSTLMTLYGAVKARNQERNAEVSHREKVGSTIERIVRGHIHQPLSNFNASLAKHVESSVPDTDRLCGFEIHGIAPLAASWQHALKESTKPDPDKGRAWLILASLLATLVFWFLMSGPLVHSYGQYIPAVFRSLFGAWDEDQLRTYPAMGGGFWLTAIVLSTIPVFVIAMFVVGASLSKLKSRACLLKFKNLIHDEIEKGTVTIDVQVHDPKIHAYQRVLSIIKSDAVVPQVIAFENP